MSLAVSIFSVVSLALTFISFLVDHLKPTKWGKRIKFVLAVVSFTAGITAIWLNYVADIETGDQLQLAHDQASEAIVQADRAQAQITEIRTPRRMDPETKRMLAARLKPHAGQKYDMKVFRDQDTLELATAIQTILEEAGWVYTNVYPTQATRRYAETRNDGVFIISGKVETRGTSEARKALHDALIEAGLYDDSSAFIPVSCGESTGPIQEGTKVTPIPCSESSIQSIELDFTVHDEVIPDDTLVLHVGKERL